MTGAIQKWVRLEQPRLGTRVTFATDEFFGARDRLIDPAEPVFIEDKYDDHGKWMDGWESRRRRDDGHDYCVIKLGVPGVIHGFDVDTSFFTGNFPSQVSIEACVGEGDAPEEGWVELVPKMDLSGDSHHFFDAREETVFTHVRLHIFPDGGVARLRIF
ncbi:MAG: allantoicase, partial [Proteobacteria bacterium]|nr:allantoicase [Pseudomonadota bacterium]